jgi:chemotaxis protein methyltransferase CheR
MLTRDAKKNENEWRDDDSVGPPGPVEFEQIRQLARRTFGLDLKSGKEQMVAARLRRLLHEGGFRSYGDYHRHVVRDATGQALAAMIDALATNHTAFLREPAHFDFFRSHVIPQIARETSPEVWCAACSTGEEVWTLAFLMNDALPSHRFQIAATDISNKALQIAQRAVYPADRCAGLPENWLKRYMGAKGMAPQSYQVSTEIRRLVRFHRVNLLEPLPWLKHFPAIFCRNVMIYFDQATQERVVAQLARCLNPGGYLFVGHAESLPRVGHGLEYVSPAVYRKSGKSEDKWTKSW